VLSPLALVTAATLGVLLLGVGFAWAFARWYTMPRRRPLEATPTDHGLPQIPVAVSCGQARLDAWLVPRLDDRDRNRRVVIVVHGWSSNKTGMLPVSAVLHRAGFDVLLFDARGHGASDPAGPITMVKFAEDIVAVVDHLHQHLGPIAQVGVVGHSLGGAAAILAASLDKRIHCVVSSSAFADPARLTRGVMRALHLPRGPLLWVVCRFLERWLGARMSEIAPEHRIGFVDVPVLLLHGDADAYISPTNMDAIYAGSHQNNIQRRLLTGRRHSDVLIDERYLQFTTEFLIRHLPAHDVPDLSIGPGSSPIP